MSDFIQIESEQEIHARLMRDSELRVQADLENKGVDYVAERIIPALRAPLKVKRVTSTATLPKRAEPSSIGLDLYSDLLLGAPEAIGPMKVEIYAGQRKAIATSIAVEIPEIYYGRIAPRSGLAFKHGIDTLAGVVDHSYRAPLVVILQNHSDETLVVEHGTRIAQLILERADILDVLEVNELTDTVRGLNGFGSSGSK